MAFLEWRRFNFFELRKNVDNGKVAEVLADAKITVYTSGNGHIILGDTRGFIHLISRTWNIITFKAYETTVTHAVQIEGDDVETEPYLVTIGEDEPGQLFLIKIWGTNKIDKNSSAPICLKILTVPLDRNVGYRNIQATALCAQSNLLVVGMSDGTIWLRRGLLVRDRGIRQRIMRDGSAGITGLAMQNLSKQIFLFVTTLENVFSYNITVKDKEYKVSLDSMGCSEKCSILAHISDKTPNIGSSYSFMIARDDAVYCYTVEGRGPCYAVDGAKTMLDWFRNYLVIVADTKSNTIVTVLDIQNKFLVFSQPLNDVKAVLHEWGGIYIIGEKNILFHLDEKDLQSKLSLLFKKNLYDVSIRMAKNQQYDNDSLIDIFRQYADHLYTKGDHTGAVDQYIKTIGKLESSYVIRRFLDSQHIDKLTLYLQALHKHGKANENHTTLLLNCYTKLDHRDKLKEFILAEGRELDFDIDIAIQVCRRTSTEDALLLAKKYEKHNWYLKIQIEDQKNYKDAFTYIERLDFTNAVSYMKKYGKILIENLPKESTELLKNLCSELNHESQLTTDPKYCNPEEFIHLFLNKTEYLVDFLEHLVTKAYKHSTFIYDTLIENYVNLWHRGIDKNNIETKLLKLLQNQEISYDKNQALVICQTHNFSPGVLYLYEDAKMYRQILRYQMLQNDGKGDIEAALACCRRCGHQEPSLWVQTLWFCTKSATESSMDTIIPEILDVIAKERLIAPLMVLECLCNSSNIPLGVVRKYLEKALSAEIELEEEENKAIQRYRDDTKQIRDCINQLRNEPMVFQGSRCAACHYLLELPAVHCMCQHSYHQHCFQSFSENESECPACEPENKQLMEKIKTQQSISRMHETFHSDLDRSDDIFLTLSQYMSRGIFNKLTVLTDLELNPTFIRSTPTETTTVDIASKITTTKERIHSEGALRLNEGNIKQNLIAEHQKPNRVNRKVASNSVLIPTPEGRMRLDEQSVFKPKQPVSGSMSSKGSDAKSVRSDYDESKNPFANEIASKNPINEKTVPKNPFEESTNPFDEDDDCDNNLNTIH